MHSWLFPEVTLQAEEGKPSALLSAVDEKHPLFLPDCTVKTTFASASDGTYGNVKDKMPYWGFILDYH